MSEYRLSVTNQVQMCLEDLLNELNVRNYVINLSNGCKRGDNFMGLIIKVEVKGEDDKGKKIVCNLIIKTATQSETFRKSWPVCLLYEREIYFYKKVLHEFNILQKEKKVRNPFKSVVKYYSSTLNHMNEALIMEDLKNQGFELHARKQLLNYHHTLMIIKAYAKLHALSFAMRASKPKLFEELARNTQEIVFVNSDFEQLHKSFSRQAKTFLLTLDPVKDKTIYEKFKRFQNGMTDTIKKLLKSDLSDPHSVIGHGDCWINNFLFKYPSASDRQKPLSLRILDWQLVRYGSPVFDLSYSIFGCSSKEMRDKHYDDIIKQYYNTFSRFLKELGGDPQKQFSFETLQKHLKKYSVFGLHASILCLFVMSSDEEEIPDRLNDTEIKQLSDQYKYYSKNTDMYNSRMMDVLLDFERLGYDY